MKELFRGSALLICLGAAVACFDEDYNLDRINDDGNVIKLQSISAPIGSLEAITLGDLIQVEENDFIRIDGNGSYSINLEGTTDEVVFNVPTFRMKTDEVERKSKVITYNPKLVSGQSPSVPIEFNHCIEIHETSIPKEIKSVNSIHVDAALDFEFTFRSNYGHLKAIMLAAGSTLEFPTWLTLGDYDRTLVSKNGNVLTILKDHRLSESGLKFSCKATDIDFTKLRKGQGLINNGEVYVNDSLKVTGLFYMKEEDIIDKVDLDKFSASFSCAVSEIDVLSAKAIVEPEIGMEPGRIDLSALSSIFSETSNLDIYSMTADITVHNNSALMATIETDVDGFRNGSVVKSAHVGPLYIKSYDSSTFSFMKTNGVSLDGVSEVLSCIPDEIGVSNFSFAAMNEPIEYVAGSRYTFSADYRFCAPLAFGKDLDVTIERTIDVGATLGEDVKIGNMVLNLTAENEIPLGLSAEAEIYDENGMKITGSSIQIDGKIEPGKRGKAKESPLKLTITPGEATEIASVKLVFKAFCDDLHKGNMLNSGQSLKFKDISVRINNMKISL